MSEIWFRSDDHLGHENILRLSGRPFASLDEMHEVMIARHNALVSPQDMVWFHGDVALGKLDESLKLIHRFNGRKRLIMGNHDRGWQGHKRVRPMDIQRYRDAGFETLNLTPESPSPTGDVAMILPGWLGPVLLSHLPATGDSHAEDRYRKHRPEPSPYWRICGHVHEAWRVRDRQINVGVDAWDFTPVHASQLVEIMREDVTDAAPLPHSVRAGAR